MKKLILTFTLFLIALANIYGQSPELFKYQAVVRDISGNVLSNQSVSFRISLLKGSVNGISVYSETHNITTNKFGLVNLEIGNGTIVSGDFSTIDWGVDSYFVQIEMDETGGTAYTLFGTSPLLSVPYALYAKSSGDPLWKQNANDIYYNTGNIGIGTSSPSIGHGIDITGLNPTIRFEDTDALAGDAYQLINNTLGNDVLNFAIYNSTDSRAELSFNGTGDVSLMNGNLGIGTAAPNVLNGIHIKGLNPVLKFEDTDSQAGDDYSLINNTLGNDVLNFAIYNSTDARAELSFSGTGNVALMNGNLGIGTSSPSIGNGMHIKGLNPSIKFEDTDSQAGDDYQLINNTLGNDVLNFAVYNSTDARAELSFSGTGNVAVLNGNLGIGTNSPQSKVQVSNGDVYIDDIGSGVIMKSPNGSCWRLTVNDLGNPVFTSITCP